MTSAKSRPGRFDQEPIVNMVTISNERGLHARAASKFVKLVSNFEAEVTVTKGGQSVSGHSILGLMMLAAGPGTEIEISALGPQADAVASALCAPVAAQFEE